jgi:predicted Zn-dependent protease
MTAMSATPRSTLKWLAALLLTACPAVGCRSVILISPAQEIAIGNEAAPQFEEEFGGRVDNADLQRYVDSVGQRIAKTTDWDMPYAFTVLRSKTPNAFALPGGKVYVTAGLMERMGNEQQLAAVLGHEISHVTNRHNVKHMQEAIAYDLLAEVAARAAGKDRGRAAETVTKVVGQMVQLKHSREDEYEADEYGIRYMAKAGYNPWGMVELLTVLKNLSESEPGTFTEMFQTHPATSKRIERAREQIESEAVYRAYSPQAADPYADRFRAMRERLP